MLLNGQRLPIKSFKDYVDLYVKDKEAPRVHEKVNDRWEICICASEGQFQQVQSLSFNRTETFPWDAERVAVLLLACGRHLCTRLGLCIQFQQAVMSALKASDPLPCTLYICALNGNSELLGTERVLLPTHAYMSPHTTCLPFHACASRSRVRCEIKWFYTVWSAGAAGLGRKASACRSAL